MTTDTIGFEINRSRVFLKMFLQRHPQSFRMQYLDLWSENRSKISLLADIDT